MSTARVKRGRAPLGPLVLASLAIAAALGAPRPVSEAGSPQAHLEGPPASYETELERFRASLAACQRGEDFDAEALAQSAERLARLHGRGDAPGAAAHYLALSVPERRAGWDAFLAFRELWSRLARADENTWEQERASLAADLEAFLAASAPLADRAPHARGLSLRARIAVHALEARRPGERNGEATLAAARADARTALGLFEASGLVTPTLEPRWLLGRLALFDEDLFGAARAFEIVLEGARLVRNDEFREHALLGLLAVARRSGDAHRARRLIEELASFRDARECWPLAREHALSLLHADHPAEAARFLARTVPAAAPARRDWSFLSGLAHLRQGELSTARALLEAGDPEADESSRLALAALALREGRAAAVVEALGDDALLARFSPHGEMFARSLLGEAQLRLARPERALRELEHALALAEHWETRLVEQRLLGDATATVMGEWVGLQAVAHLVEALAALGRPLEAATAIARAQGRALRRTLGEGEPAAADLAAWAARYEHGLLTWVAGADSGAVAWVAPDGSAHAAPLALSRGQLAGGVRRLAEAALAEDARDAARLGEELGAALLPAALRTHLGAAPGGRLLALLHGPLERLPLSLLHVEGAALDEWCAPLASPGLPAQRPGPSASFDAWTLLGDPLGADGRPLLPGAGPELDAVARERPAARRIAGADLDARAFESALASGDCLHLATHAERRAGEGRLEPYALALSGGATFDAPRIAALAPRSPLVVLSACATAEGRLVDAEGLFGLSRAFLEGGTRNLLATLWPVTDAAAAAFAAPYHAALTAGLPPSQAAAHARATLAAQAFPLADQAAFQSLGRD